MCMSEDWVEEFFIHKRLHICKMWEDQNYRREKNQASKTCLNENEVAWKMHMWKTKQVWLAQMQNEVGSKLHKWKKTIAITCTNAEWDLIRITLVKKSITNDLRKCKKKLDHNYTGENVSEVSCAQMTNMTACVPFSI